mgnify:CR=1 FL=1
MKANQVKDLSETISKLKEHIPFSSLLEECYVGGCHTYSITPIAIKRFDPIDREPLEVKLCDKHLEWARERNEFATEMHEKIEACQESTGKSAVECRKQVGSEHIERVQELASPQGEMREDVLDGSIKETRDTITLEEALEVQE